MIKKNLKKQLKSKLKELFQFENEDLDFGIYRITNYKKEEIKKFIENDLIDDIKKQLMFLSENEKETELENLEKKIYNHLINFFSRYYENGDFISKKRYGKKEKYFIPYNGEEVYLYWVNKDQYYIKTTEYFRKYTFRIEELIVNFKVIETEEEKGNVKSQEKKFFVLNEKIFDFDEEKNELNIYFKYKSLTDEEKNKYKYGNSISQEKINEEIFEDLKKELEDKFKKLFEIINSNKENYKKYFLGKHLYKYTRKNKTDFFIHKDLKGFLEKELDFYIKNEVLQLENLRILKNNVFLKIEAFKNIALKIIEFLAQIENFQKKLWEKKKFVIDTHYVITLDKVKEYAGEEFLEGILDEILSNEKQLKEWKELFGIEVKNKNDLIEKDKEYKKLPIDTKYFDEKFKWKLLIALSKKNGLDEILDGVLIKSENFQGLNLLLNKYYEKIQTIYIDPPFNKDSEADYLYKVGYKDATWITMLENRIRLSKEFLNEKGSIFVRCDYNGNYYVRFLLNEVFGKDNFRNEIGIRRFKKNTMEKEIKKLPEGLDTIYVYAKNFKYFSYLNPFKMKNEKRRGFWRHMGDSSGQGSSKVFFGKELSPPQGKHWKYSQEKIDKMIEEKKLILKCKHCKYIHNKGLWKGCPICGKDDPQPKYWVEERDTEILDSNWSDIYGYSTTWKFKTENSESLLKRVIESTSNKNDLVLDFFLGSATTIAVAHKLKRKWVGIEMGEHFYTVILPRMKKVLFYDKSGISKEKDVKEKYNPKMAGGFFKYHILEQYEDALENIEFEKVQKNLLELSDYFVKYMLEWETKKSKTFLNFDALKNPFDYKLKILEDYQQKVVNVDVVETFNYLLGLNVKFYKMLKENNRKYLFVFGEKEGKKIVVIWRSIENIDFKKDKEVIENTIKDFNPDEIYINKEAILEGFKSIELLFKLLIINV